MKKHAVKLIVACVVLAAVIIAFAVPFTGKAAAEGREDSIRSITDTVRQMALQCYVIEGAYPESLDYLEENYGLTVNKEDFMIVYTPFAENLPPDVRVIDRNA